MEEEEDEVVVSRQVEMKMTTRSCESVDYFLFFFFFKCVKNVGCCLEK